ncbi:hypothetical protein KQI88_17850, partial [Alkaliphilus sp. MSJ-5]|nr:hypothetical protein [Alkaliphilus flagellatus]
MDNREVFINNKDVEIIIKSKNAEDCHSKFENAVAHKKPESKTSCVEVKAETLGDCDNNPVRLNPITAGVVAKIPV